MHQTPDVPGTSPVTDNPNPGGSQGMDPGGPSTGPGRPEPEPEPVPGTKPEEEIKRLGREERAA